MTSQIKLQWSGSALYITNKETGARIARMETTQTTKRDALSIMSAMNALDVYVKEIAKLKRQIEVLEAKLDDKPVPLLPHETLAAVSVYQASQRLGCSTDRVLHGLMVGTLTGFKVGGRWRVYESCLPNQVRS